MLKSESEQLKEELKRATQRIAELEARLAFEVKSKEAPSWLYITLDIASIGVWDWDITLDKITWNESTYRIYGLTPQTFNNTLSALMEVTFPDDRAVLGERIQYTLATGEPYHTDFRIYRPDGSIRWIEAIGKAFFNETGQPYRLAGTALDVTARKREQAESVAMQQKIIDAQRETLRELGAPIIPLADRTLVVPLVGLLTRERAEQVNEALLRAVREVSAEVVLLDVTGVPSVDCSVAQALLRAAHAVRLLGARVVLTGVRPPFAKTLVELGIDMRAFVVKANLQSGIEYAAGLRKSGAL